MKSSLLIPIWLIFLSAAVVCADEGDEFFEARVRPLLAKRCFECHRRQAEGGLRLDSREAILRGGGSGPALIPGNVSGSLLWQAVAGKHDELSMPPEEPLKDGDIKILVRWIEDGAPWPAALPAARATPDEHGISEEERTFWSFQPIAQAVPPEVEGEWGRHPVDAFVAAKRHQLDLVAGEPLAARELLRRLSYDLIGLPPTPSESHAFERAAVHDFDRALRDAIDRLLASRQYGERWGQHWLDLVRYADTAGDASDYPIPEAYKYRNYVIDAFNTDKPYDQFVREQIAGDLMPVEDEAESWQRTIATGYIAITRRVGVSPFGKPHITIEDTLNNLGKTFLGLTIGCARCHDHKFDPIPTSDYYALFGIFSSTIYPHPGAEHRPYRSDFVYRVGDKRAGQILGPYRASLDELRKIEREMFERYRDFQRKPINIPGLTREVAWKSVLAERERIRQVAETFPDLETAFAVREGEPDDTFVQEQGDPRNRGPRVRRGFLQVLGGQTLPDDARQSGRRELANWITSPENPLTARVIANRVWHHHFGRGLVATTSDFGLRGTPPSHPELLDYLARSLIDHGWSIKHLHRLILTSKTWRLSSRQLPANLEIDPDNVYLWRGPRRRLDAEQLRDSILFHSGQLDTTPGGAHPFPHRLAYFYRQHEPFVGDFPTNKRSVYQFRQRIRKNRYLDLFDGPDGNLHVGTRRPTTTSLQSLYLMNSPFVEEHSRAIARRILDEVVNRDEQIRWAYEHLLGRPAMSDEIAMGNQLLAQMRGQLNDDAAEKEIVAMTSLVRAMISSNAYLFVE